MSPRLHNAVVIVVTVVWATNFLARLVLPHYQPPVQVDAVFMAIVGGAMALSRDKRAQGNDPSPRDSEPTNGGDPE